MKQKIIRPSKMFGTTLMVVALATSSVQSQTTMQTVAEGKQVYTMYCANCHGAEAQGATKAGFDIVRANI